MKTIWLATAVWVLTVAMCYGRGSVKAGEISTLRFDNLTEEELAQDPARLLPSRLLTEAERRKVEPDVREYLRVSYDAWLGKNRFYSEIVMDKTESAQIRRLFERELDTLMKGPYLAKLTDEEASFGQFFVKGEVLQVVDKANLLASVRPIGEEGEKLIWITGLPRGGFIDEAELSLAFFAKRLWALEGDGTRSYTNALGVKRTVLCIRPHDLDIEKVSSQIDLFEFGRYWMQIREARARAARLAAEKAKRDAAEAAEKRLQEAKRRTWTSGQYKVDAEFVSLIAGKVTLKRLDNDQQITLPMERLSKEDQEFIRWRKWLKQPPPAKKP